MEDVLQEIRFIPGIVGSFVYVDKLGVVTSDLPEKYDEDTVHQMGRVLSRLFQVKNPACEAAQTLGLGFDDLILTSCKIQQDAAVVTLGDPTVNADFVTMTVGSLMGDLVSLVDEARAEAAAAPPTRPSEPIAEPALPVDPEPAAPPPPAADSRLTPALKGLERCLTQAIGPAAAVVMNDAVVAWSAAGEASMDRLGDLLDQLAGEVDDPELKRAFLAEAAPVLPRADITESGEPAPVKGGLSDQELAPLQAHLAGAVGPVAGMMLADAAARWRASGGGTADTLGALVDALCVEIGDPALEETFRGAAEPLVRARAPAAQPPGPATGSVAGEDLEAVLAQLGEALSQAIGPIAQLVMGDALEEWRAGGASAARLGELVERLCREIPDDALTDGFRRQAAEVLPG